MFWVQILLVGFVVIFALFFICTVKFLFTAMIIFTNDSKQKINHTKGKERKLHSLKHLVCGNACSLVCGLGASVTVV